MGNESTKQLGTPIASASAAIVNLIIIMIFGQIYQKLAVKLTEWGNCILHVTISNYM